MNRFVWSRMALVASVSACAALMPGLAQAEESGDSLSLKIANALKPDRFFMRAGVIGINIKTKSGDTYDVTGPVVSKAEMTNVFPGTVVNQRFVSSQGLTIDDYSNIDWTTGGDPTTAQANYDLFMYLVHGGALPVGIETIAETVPVTGLGTPAGIKGEAAKYAGTAGISLGYFLDDEHKWMVETFVLAAPVASSVQAFGRVPDGRRPRTKSIGINDKTIINTKLVPPTLMFGRYWGAKEAKFRPYTGLLAMYAIFTDTTATETLNRYVGGSSPGDTTVSIKNKFGMGPMVGLKYQFAEDWHMNFNVGFVKLKTQATLTTRNSMFNDSTGAIYDLGPVSADFRASIDYINDNFDPDVLSKNGGVVGIVSRGIAADRAAGRSATPGDGQTLGTYVRKTDTTLTSTLFMLSVGRSF